MKCFFLGLAQQVPVVPDGLDDGVVRFRAGACIEEPVQALGQDLRELGGELDRGDGRGLEEGIVVGKLLQLLVGDARQAFAAVADVDAPEPGHAVDDPVAFAVGDVAAVGRCDDPAALGVEFGEDGERMQVVHRVELAPALGFGTQRHRAFLLIGGDQRCKWQAAGRAARQQAMRGSRRTVAAPPIRSSDVQEQVLAFPRADDALPRVRPALPQSAPGRSRRPGLP
jgi:hypothetical protein